MKKSNKILSLITSSVLCTQVISVPMFAMKPAKISTTSYDTRSANLNNQIHVLATEIRNSGIDSVKLVFSKLVYSIISKYNYKFKNISYDKHHSESKLINIQMGVKSNDIPPSILLLQIHIFNIINVAPARHEIHESTHNLKILIKILTKIRDVVVHN